jgi:hypothetical protein
MAAARSGKAIGCGPCMLREPVGIIDSEPGRPACGIGGVITAVLAGSAGGLLAAVASGHSLIAALVAGVIVAAAALTGLMRYQNSAWIRGSTAPLFRGAAGPS